MGTGGIRLDGGDGVSSHLQIIAELEALVEMQARTVRVLATRLAELGDTVTGRDEIAEADEAYRIGLVNAVYPQAELMENVLKLANKIAKNAPIAVRNCKKAINDGISLPIEKAVEVEEKLFGDCFETHDQVEGMGCFLSREKPKPKPVFTNN